MAQQQIPEKIKNIEDSLLYEIAISDDDSIKYRLLYKLSQKLYLYDYLKGLKYIDQSIKIAEEIEELRGIVQGYYLKGIIYYYMSHYDRSLEELFKAESVNHEFGSDLFYANIYNYIGINYKNLDQKQKALLYYKKSKSYCLKIKDRIRLAYIYNNIGNIHRDYEQYDSALYYYDKSLQYTKIVEDVFDVHLNKLHVYLRSGKLELASKELKITDTLMSNIDQAVLHAELYYLKGIYFRQKEMYKDAISNLNMSINISKETKSWQNMSLSAKQLSEIYVEKNDYDNAFVAQSIIIQANDSLNYGRPKVNVVRMEANNKFEKYIKEQEIEKQKKKLAYFIYLMFFIIPFFIILFLFYRQRKNIKYKKQEYEIKKQLFDSGLRNISLEKTHLKDDLKYKNKELMNYALQLVQDNDFILNIMKEIKSLRASLTKEENIKRIDDISMYINQNMNMDKARKEFYVDIEMLNKAFFHNLSQKFPDLTKNEKRLALLLRLNFSSKRIASLLNVSIHTVESSRYRLRKKMEIDSETNLSEFFNSL